ncbi:MAG: lipid-binding SYLF domain-containing protein [Candidatus Omnitrophica bacterium]|nr:lipid-binding SYLF domain-containing protein [Candidatus Omnitrophota bacterium]MBU4488415.1 lipid-binding SYLF domain-containing protein [Candidatus Omnitrophota bacterium]
MILFFSIVILLLQGSAIAENKWTALVEESGKVLAEIQQMPDEGIPDDLLRECAAIAVFPSTISAGFGIGGKYGQGIIMVREDGKNKWSAPAIFNLVGGSIGWQIGGQATDFVLLIGNKRSVDGILQGKFKLGADVSVAAGPIGRAAEASTDVQLKGGILSYSRSRGLFAGAKLEGAVITQHWDGNKELYGKGLSANEILLENKAKMPDSAKAILSVLNKYPYKK